MKMACIRNFDTYIDEYAFEVRKKFDLDDYASKFIMDIVIALYEPDGFTKFCDMYQITVEDAVLLFQTYAAHVKKYLEKRLGSKYTKYLSKLRGFVGCLLDQTYQNPLVSGYIDVHTRELFRGTDILDDFCEYFNGRVVEEDIFLLIANTAYIDD